MCPKSSLFLLLLLVFYRRWGSCCIPQVKAATLIPLFPNITWVRLTVVTCCKPEGLKCIWYWLSLSSFTYSISSVKGPAPSTDLQTRNVTFGLSGRRVFPAWTALCSPVAPDSWLPGWVQLQVREPSAPGNLSPTCTKHATTCWPWLSRGGLKGPSSHWCGPACHLVPEVHRLPKSRLTCDLFSGIHDLSFLQGSLTILSSLTWTLESDRPGFESLYWYLLASWLRTSGITSLRLSFFLCKIIYLTRLL